ncbi:uncharacterized protein LOC144438473 isoform X2 [Glandiceps talaboti]
MSTDTFQGMENMEKPPTRVLAPPGGASSFQLGDYGGDDGGQPNSTPAMTQDEAAPESVDPANAPSETPNTENADSSNPAPESEEPSNAQSETPNTENAEPSDPAPADDPANAQSETTKTENPEPSNPAPAENNVPAVNGTADESPKESPAKTPPKSPKSPKSPTQKSPIVKSPTTKSPPKSPRGKAPSPKKSSSEPKSPREKASTPRTPRVKAPTPRSQTPRSSTDTPRKNDTARGEKPDMVFGPLIVETRPGSGKRHFQQRIVDTKNNLFGETPSTPQDAKHGTNRRNVSTLYMGGDDSTPTPSDSKPTRRQYHYHESNSFSAVFGRPGEDPNAGQHESRKKPGKHEDGISPITGHVSGGQINQQTDTRSRKPDRMRPEELPAAGVKAYEEEPRGRIPPGGKSSGIF